MCGISEPSLLAPAAESSGEEFFSAASPLSEFSEVLSYKISIYIGQQSTFENLIGTDNSIIANFYYCTYKLDTVDVQIDYNYIKYRRVHTIHTNLESPSHQTARVTNYKKLPFQRRSFCPLRTV